VCIISTNNSRHPVPATRERNSFALFLTFSTSSLYRSITTHHRAFRDDFCRKYRYMDSNLTQRRRGLEEKIPDIKKTLNMVEFLRDRRVRDKLTLIKKGPRVRGSILPPLNFLPHSFSPETMIYLMSVIGGFVLLSFGHSFFQEGKNATKGSGAGDSDDLDDDELEDEENDGGKPVPIRTTFELADTLYAEAELEETDTVYLWLGVRFHSHLFSVSVLE
jgi:hypothetical protein